MSPIVMPWLRIVVALLALAAPVARGGEARTIGRCGDGFLEEVDGTKVLHVKGTPHAMGVQHGVLLRRWRGAWP